MTPNLLADYALPNVCEYVAGRTFDQRIQEVLPYWLAPRAADFPLPLSTPTTGINTFIFTNQNFQMGVPTTFVATKSIMNLNTFGDSPRIRFRDNQNNRDLMNYWVSATNIFGQAGRGYQLPEPLIIDANADLQMQTNGFFQSGTASNRMYLHGRQYYLMNGARRAEILERKRYISPFWLTPEADVNLSANTTTSYQVKIAQGHFRGLQIQVASTSALTFKITDVLRRQTLMNGATPFPGPNAQYNVGMYPNWQSVSFMLPQGSVLRFELTDLSGASNKVSIAIAGQMLYCPIREVQPLLRDLAKPWKMEFEA